MKFFFIGKLIKIILFTKFDFLSPKKNKILVFDHEGLSTALLLNSLPEEQIHILHTRKERLNLYVIFFNFIKGKFTALDYFHSYINYVNPKIIITAIDNNPIFYRLRKNFTQNKRKNLNTDYTEYPVKIKEQWKYEFIECFAKFLN